VSARYRLLASVTRPCRRQGTSEIASHVAGVSSVIRNISLVVIMLVALSVAGCGVGGSAKKGPTPLPKPTPVNPEPAVATGYLGPVTFASGESGTHPAGPTDRFDVGTKTVYAFFNFEGLKPEDTIAAVWYQGTGRLLEQDVKASEILGSNLREYGHLWLSIQFEQGAPAGSYSLELNINGTFAQSGSFSVNPQ
jgi:predicted small lipoprotein YifL